MDLDFSGGWSWTFEFTWFFKQICCIIFCLSFLLWHVSLSEEEQAIIMDVASRVSHSLARFLEERHVVSAHSSHRPTLETDFPHKQFCSLESQRRLADWSNWGYNSESKRERSMTERRREWEGRRGPDTFYSDVKAEMLINVYCSCHINWINKYQTKAGGEAPLQTRKWKFHLVWE